MPITLVETVCDNILNNGSRVMRAMLGITISVTGSKGVVDEYGRIFVEEEFSVVTPASKGSAAYGKMNAGDIFISAKVNDGETVVFTKEYQLVYVMLSVRKGDMVTFVMRNASGEETTVVVAFDKDNYFVAYD